MKIIWSRQETAEWRVKKKLKEFEESFQKTNILSTQIRKIRELQWAAGVVEIRFCTFR